MKFWIGYYYVPREETKLGREGARMFQTADKRRRIKHELIITCAPQLYKSFNWNFSIVREKGTSSRTVFVARVAFSVRHFISRVIDFHRANSVTFIYKRMQLILSATWGRLLEYILKRFWRTAVKGNIASHHAVTCNHDCVLVSLRRTGLFVSEINY